VLRLNHFVRRDSAERVDASRRVRLLPYNQRMTDRRTGLILYVHGARDPRWVEPFERLRVRVAAQAPQCIVTLAFLEHMVPDLASAAVRVAAQGADTVRIVPMFFGRGGHLRDDFPRALDAARKAAPGVTFVATQAAGENEQVQDALAEFALQAPSVQVD
jgi:sirohydrochlorin cobaltochelatase